MVKIVSLNEIDEDEICFGTYEVTVANDETRIISQTLNDILQDITTGESMKAVKLSDFGSTASFNLFC